MEKPNTLSLKLESENRATLKKEMVFPTFIKHPNLAPNPGLGPDPDNDPNELSIFDAQKYFNGSVVTIQKPTRRVFGSGFGLDRIPERDYLRISSASSTDTFGMRHASYATPTSSSEASWNSQAGLLMNPPDANPVSILKTPASEKRRRARKWLFGPKCPCYGRSSILVEDNHGDGKVLDTPTPTPMPTPAPIITSAWQEKRRVTPAAPTRDAFTFPILVPHNRVILRAPASQREPSRESLEVFQPAQVREEDLASDASSDLFEIESFSTQSNYPNPEEGRRGGSYSDAPSVYEPSEVSIEWSVVTASAATNCSAVELETIAGEQEGKRCVGLLGCDCCNSVRVVRCGPEDGQRAARPAISSFKAAPQNPSRMIPFAI